MKRKNEDVIIAVYETRGGRELTLELPCTREVCDTCQGRGHIVNPAIDGNGLTREDFEQDPDFEEGYFSGRYDITCPECKGANVVPVVDEDACRTPRLKRALAAYNRQQEQRAQWDAEDRYTRRMESGGYDY